MTITFRSTKGVHFRVDVFLKDDHIECRIEVTATKEAYLRKSTFIIPYHFADVFIPFDFNGSEEEIMHGLRNMFKDFTHQMIRTEELVDVVDMVMAENVNVLGMDLLNHYRIINKSSV
uniref:SatC1 n=3 Tax=Cotton leaf curl Gezira betasatellite TaxID=304222 RepID=Q80RG0_9VIRU|nr:unknown [Cotton leaf curl Gezira beta - [Sudan:Okra 43:1996]]AAL05305.1 unknown [Cotton leaf curl Gezira beta - [Sudan:Okra 44-2:96]]AAL91096.1 SatC1 [Cotton leaf curl Gezira betasatellite]ACP41025.1 SatC1 [Cotton leaf curl Gezira betasatellite]